MPLQAWKAAMTESGAWLESLSADSFTLLPASRGERGTAGLYGQLLWAGHGRRSHRGRGVFVHWALIQLCIHTCLYRGRHHHAPIPTLESGACGSQHTPRCIDWLRSSVHIHQCKDPASRCLPCPQRGCGFLTGGGVVDDEHGVAGLRVLDVDVGVV